jgi:hypothetical protein
VFGGLLLLDASETTYCVPLNRAASILGGIAGAAGLALLFGQPAPSSWELVGAGLLVAAIVVLWFGPAVTPTRRLRDAVGRHLPRRARRASRSDRDRLAWITAGSIASSAPPPARSSTTSTGTSS